MLTLKDFPQALVTYHRKPTKYTSKVVYNEMKDENGFSYTVPTAVIDRVRGEKKGVLVAIGPGIVGWSMCKEPTRYFSDLYDDGDKFDKAIGMHIAFSRAIKAKELSTYDREMLYDNVPTTLQPAFAEMVDRSFKYFQSPDEEDEK